MKIHTVESAQKKADRLKARLEKMEGEFYGYFPDGLPQKHYLAKAYENERKRLTQEHSVLQEFAERQRVLKFK
jgi:hypothetical protein